MAVNSSPTPPSNYQPPVRACSAREPSYDPGPVEVNKVQHKRAQEDTAAPAHLHDPPTPPTPPERPPRLISESNTERTSPRFTLDTTGTHMLEAPRYTHTRSTEQRGAVLGEQPQTSGSSTLVSTITGIAGIRWSQAESQESRGGYQESRGGSRRTAYAPNISRWVRGYSPRFRQ